MFAGIHACFVSFSRPCYVWLRGSSRVLNLGNREHIVHETPKRLIVVTTFQYLPLRAKSAS